MDIKTSYESGISAYQIAREIGLSPCTIYGRLRKLGVKIRKSGETRTKALKHLQDLLTDFDNGKSVCKLAKQYGYSISGMSHLIKRNGRKILRQEDKIDRDWSFLSKKDALFFYWLGWMLSDGNIYYKTRVRGNTKLNSGITVCLTVHKKDTHILEFFRDKIQKSANIKSKNKSNSTKLCVNIPRNYANIVNEYGFIPNKTYKFKPTQQLDDMIDEQFLQFLCGFIEGDGSITTSQIECDNKYIYNVLRLVIHGGGATLITWIANKLEKLGFTKRKIQERKAGWSKPSQVKYKRTPKNWINTRYSIQGRDAIKLIKMLLNCEYHLLDRKWDKAKQFF